MISDLRKPFAAAAALSILLAGGPAAKAEESTQPSATRTFVLYGIEPYSGQSFHSLAGEERDQFKMPMYRTAPVPKDAEPIVEVEQAVDEFEPGALAIANVSDPPVTLEFKILPRVPRADWRQRDHAEPYAYYLDALGDRYPTKDSEPGLRALPMKNLRLATAAFMWVPGYGFEMPDALPPLGSNLITVPAGETRFVWITVDSHGLEPGEYGLDLEVRVTNYVGKHQPDDACEAGWPG